MSGISIRVNIVVSMVGRRGQVTREMVVNGLGGCSEVPHDLGSPIRDLIFHAVQEVWDLPDEDAFQGKEMVIETTDVPRSQNI